MNKCVMCADIAQVEVSWLVSSGLQKHKVCDACGHLIWNKISANFSGTEACMSFTIEPIEV